MDHEVGAILVGESSPRNPIDPRRTFLRRHVHDELQRRSEILALEAICEQLTAEHVTLCGGRRSPEQEREFESRLNRCAWLQPHRFFYERRTDLLVYHDVQLLSIEKKTKPYDSLTALLDKRRNLPGIVLRARSGAGKTVACRRAFFDCFFQGQRFRNGVLQSEPNLFGYLSCLLHLDRLAIPAPPATGLPLYSSVLDLVRQAAQQPHLSLETLEACLLNGPPLILFLDLNVLSPVQRRMVAEALNDFLKKFAKFGHRCVVTYRSAESNDQVFNVLGSSFEAFDLAPLTRDQAAGYIGNIQNYAAAAVEPDFGDLKLKLPAPAEIEVAQQKALSLMERYAGRGESLISTPLLMHFVTQIVDRLEHVQSLSDVYREVVNKHLRRDQKVYANVIPHDLSGDAGVQRIRVALTRMGLALHALGVTRLPGNHFHSLLCFPRATKQGDWRPSDPDWDVLSPPSVPYYAEAFSSPEVTALREFSFLRLEGDQIRFLHDSMIDYHAGAAALGEFQGPDMPPAARSETGPSPFRELPDEWHATVARIFRQNAARWQKAAGFLAGSLGGDELRMLLKELLFQPSDRAWVELFQMVLRGRPAIKDAVADGMEGAILHHGSWCLNHPETLLEIIVDDLMGDLTILVARVPGT